jgi:putative endonuclease
MLEAMGRWIAHWIDRPVTTDSLGRRGESAASRHLRDQGLKILDRNFRCKEGEIDIVARDGQTIVFVEVKTRSDRRQSPEHQVDRSKQGQIAAAARRYLNRYGTPTPPARFDVVAVVWEVGTRPTIRHIIDAFPAPR